MKRNAAIGLWLCLWTLLGFMTTTSVRAQTTTLEFWMPGQEPTIRSTMEGLIKKFEAQNPRIRVNYTQVPWSEWFTKLTAALAGNLTPDISGLGYGQFGMLVGKDVFAELSLDPADRQDIADWTLKVGSYRGKLYAFLLPETRPFAYRKDFFTEAGLDPNKPPQNWTELRDYALKLVKKRGGKVTRAGVDIPYLGWVEQVYVSFYATKKENGNLWDEGGKPTFYDREGIDTLQYLVDLKLKYDVVLPSDQQSIMGTAFESGAAAMGFPKSQGLPMLLSSKPGQIGFAPPPKEKTSTALTLGTFLAVYKNSKNKKEAQEFLRFLYSKESMWEIYKGILFLPTRKSLHQNFIADQDYNRILAECLENSVSYNVHPNFGEARKVLNDDLGEAFFGRKSPKDALKTAYDKLMELSK